MRAEHGRLPLLISVDKNAACPETFSSSHDGCVVSGDSKLRGMKYLNNVIKHDHRFIKKKVRSSQCFKSFHSAERTPEGIEAVSMMRKGKSKDQTGMTREGRRQTSPALFQIAA
jgi:transposase-like protein